MRRCCANLSSGISETEHAAQRRDSRFLVHRNRPICDTHHQRPGIIAKSRQLGGHSSISAAMLAAHHDQENVYTHQAGASKQQLQAKTPGARYPKTPLKIPLNDENATHGFNGKSVLRGKGNNENTLTVGKGGDALGKLGKQGLVTPAGKSFRTN